MIQYAPAAIALLYLVSLILRFKKIPKYKRKYALLFGIMFVLSAGMVILGALFPSETSSPLGTITGVTVFIIGLMLMGYSLYKIKQAEKRNKNAVHES